MAQRGVLSLKARAGLMAVLAGLGWSCSASELVRREKAPDAPEPPEPAAVVSLPAPPAPPAEVTAETAPPPEESETAAPPSPPEIPSDALAPPSQPELFAIAREVVIRERPSHGARKIGYLRLGARVARSAEAVGSEGCRGGWYRVMPEGYVCAGNAATLDASHPVLAFARVPDRAAPLPYSYGRASVAPPRTLELPPPSGASRLPSDWTDVESTPLPSLLAEGKSLPRPYGYTGLAGLPAVAPPNSGFALLTVFDHGGRRFGLSTDYELLPLDRLTRVRPSAFHGIALEGVGLPVVFVKSRSAFLYSGEPSKGLSVARPLGFREAVPITGESARFAGVRYLKTRSGEWLKDDRLVRVDGFKNRPTWANGARTWIHVSILQQSLVAYEGETPVYATLVSTGADGLGDPKETHSTVQGTFLIHTKHVSTTMQGDEADDAFLLSEVPYVQYFTEGYALHAAYWHDQFGTPRSHGCVNLSPIDARWLFHFTEPSVPQSWHGALSLKGGTLIRITP